jgi:anaphase-promoting complex subunit 2
MSTEFRTNKPNDASVRLLACIYDSKDLFVKELRVLLAQKLLAIAKDNSDRVEHEVQFGSSSVILSL